MRWTRLLRSSTFFKDRNSQQRGKRSKVPQHHKGHMCKDQSKHDTQLRKQRFSFSLRKRQGFILSHLLNISLEAKAEKVHNKKNSPNCVEGINVCLLAGDILYIENSNIYTHT